MRDRTQDVSLKDILYLAAPLWGPLALTPVFMVRGQAGEILANAAGLCGFLAFHYLGVRALLRTSTAGALSKIVVGGVYCAVAAVICLGAFWAACELGGMCKP